MKYIITLGCPRRILIFINQRKISLGVLEASWNVPTWKNSGWKWTCRIEYCIMWAFRWGCYSIYCCFQVTHWFEICISRKISEIYHIWCCINQRYRFTKVCCRADVTLHSSFYMYQWPSTEISQIYTICFTYVTGYQ